MAIFKKNPEEETTLETLKERGLTCSKLKSMANKQMADAKKDRNDSNQFRSLGFNKQAEFQEQIAKAQEKSAQAIKSLHKKLCPLK